MNARQALVLAFTSVAAWAQTAAPVPPAASLSGTVTRERDGQPVRRCLLILRKQPTGKPAITTISDDRGRFLFDRLAPGEYTITAEKEGYLISTTVTRDAVRQPAIFNVSKGSKIDQIAFQLQTSAVVSGKVVYDDGEPALGAKVSLYRSEFRRGQHAFRTAGTSYSNYLGEYSFYGLPPGVYLLAAEESPSRTSTEAKPQERVDAYGSPIPDETYLRTFYPTSARLSQAATIPLSAGQEMSHLDIRLIRGRRLRVHGHVMSMESGNPIDGGKFALLTMARDNASIEVPAKLVIGKGGEFELLGVPPGDYELRVQSAEQGQLLTDALPLRVGESNLENVEVQLRAEVLVDGEIRVSDDLADLNVHSLNVAFEPRADALPERAAKFQADRRFQVKLSAGEDYDVFVQNLTQEACIRRIQSGGIDALKDGLRVPRGPRAMVEVEIGRCKGQVTGRAIVNDNEIAAGASITLVPDFPAGRLQAFRGTYSNEQGEFLLQGVVPGRYIAYAWVDDPPCDFYDPNYRAVCPAGEPVVVGDDRAAGILVRLTQRQ